MSVFFYLANHTLWCSNAYMGCSMYTSISGLYYSKTTWVWWSVWCYHTVWSGIGIPKAEPRGRSHSCCNVTPHEVIISYRLPDKECFAFISECFMNNCKISIFFAWDDPFPAICDYCDITLIHCSKNKSMRVTTMDGWRGDIKGWDRWKWPLTKFILNTILPSLGYWPTIVPYCIRYKKKITIIWCAVCWEIFPHTCDPQQIIMIDWLTILFQFGNTLSTITIFGGCAIYTYFMHHSYIYVPVYWPKI